MNRDHNLGRLGIPIALLCVCGQALALPSDWQHDQRFEITSPGLVKLDLPMATLDSARPGLEDLRLYDASAREVPFLIERPAPPQRVIQPPTSFQVSVYPATTVLTLETGLSHPINGVTLETPARSFLKAVRIEGSSDGRTWQTLSRGQPIFRQPAGASQLHLAFSAARWPWLKLMVDDQRSEPIPFTGARVHAATVEPAITEPVPVTILRSDENPGETRLTVSLGAANLDVAAVQVETSEPLFTRQVTAVVPQVEEGRIHEQAVAHGVVYRVAVDGQPASSRTVLPVESQVRSRELVLLIENKDSPPLPIEAVYAKRHPVYLVFLARAAGKFHLLSGNRRCAAPNYDLAALGANFRSLGVSPLQFSPLLPNPSYRSPEVLPGIQAGGTAIDLSAWEYRKDVRLDRAGAQRLELDLDVLAHAQPGFSDLRLVSATNQFPYILEPTSISRSLTPTVTTSTDPKDPQISRWMIKLPLNRLPITRLTCTAQTPLFQRDMTLYEELYDGRGEKYRRQLGGATWVQTPGRTNQQFLLRLDSPPQSDTLVLETHNGDNPAIRLDKVQCYYPATRILFKAQPADELLLYYSNPQAAAPHYDLSLGSGQLLTADQAKATLGREQQLKTSWGEGRRPGQGGVVFWGILTVVVVALLVIISRLLPKSAGPT